MWGSFIQRILLLISCLHMMLQQNSVERFFSVDGVEMRMKHNDSLTVVKNMTESSRMSFHNNRKIDDKVVFDIIYTSDKFNANNNDNSGNNKDINDGDIIWWQNLYGTVFVDFKEPHQILKNICFAFMTLSFLYFLFRAIRIPCRQPY